MYFAHRSPFAELWLKPVLSTCFFPTMWYVAGLALPLVVPPIREYFNTPARKNPPPVKDVCTPFNSWSLPEMLNAL